MCGVDGGAYRGEQIGIIGDPVGTCNGMATISIVDFKHTLACLPTDLKCHLLLILVLLLAVTLVRIACNVDRVSGG